MSASPSAPPENSGTAHVLVVEDSSVFREMQGLLLRQAGYEVALHENPQAALEDARRRRFDLVIIDYELPDMNGQQFMLALRETQPGIAAIFVSGSLTLQLAIQLTSQGVAGIFNKPANPKSLLEKVTETLARHSARDSGARAGSNNASLPTARRGHPAATTAAEPAADRVAYTPRFITGTSTAFREFSHRLWKVRDFRAVLLLQGEPGSPFELFAREIAEHSVFRDGPVMLADAAEFTPPRLIEVLAPSILSHDAGTLIVDGVETFTEEQQATLENLITGRDVFLPFARRFRLVLSATHRLSERVDAGTFGETLYYKISSLTLAVPSLREMREDILPNAERLLALKPGPDGRPPVLAPDAAEWLQQQDWPGNYEEFARVLLHAAAAVEGGTLPRAALLASHRLDQATPVAPAPRRVAAPRPLPPPVAPEPAPAAPPASSPPALGAIVRAPAPPPAPAATAPASVAPPAPSDSVAPAAPAAPAPAAAPTHKVPAAVGRAPARQLFAKPAAPTLPPASPSAFRPASAAFDFRQRLADTLAAADRPAA